MNETLYYTTKYGSPLAYSRPIDLLGQAGLEDVSGRKILLDFGYGTVGHLRLLAGLGADVTSMNVDPMLRPLYGAQGDRGNRQEPARPRWPHPAHPWPVPGRRVREECGGGDYDLILSKNTLKRGYVHPERPVEPRRLLNLGVEDAAFVRSLHDALKPGGRVLIYNICPAPSPLGQPYKNWADGRCPLREPGKPWASAFSRSTATIPRSSASSPTPWDGTRAIRPST